MRSSRVNGTPTPKCPPAHPLVQGCVTRHMDDFDAQGRRSGRRNAATPQCTCGLTHKLARTILLDIAILYTALAGGLGAYLVDKKLIQFPARQRRVAHA